MLNGLRRKHNNEETLRFAQSDKDFLDSPFVLMLPECDRGHIRQSRQYDTDDLQPGNSQDDPKDDPCNDIRDVMYTH